MKINVFVLFHLLRNISFLIIGQVTDLCSNKNLRIVIRRKLLAIDDVFVNSWIKLFYTGYINSTSYIFQTLQADKSNGLELLTSNESLSEQLHPETSSIGRETIRQQQQKAKESWEAYNTNLAISLKGIENTMVQWTQYDDSYTDIKQWLDSIEAKILPSLNYMNTLPEKREYLQDLKVCFWINLSVR